MVVFIFDSYSFQVDGLFSVIVNFYPFSSRVVCSVVSFGVGHDFCDVQGR